MTATPSSLSPPLSVAWHAKTGTILEHLATHDDIVVVSAKDVLIGLDLATGDERWRRPLRKRVGIMPATERGPVVCSFEKGITQLDAFDWTGEPRWSLRRDWFCPADGIRAHGTVILCAGRYNDNGPSVCAYVDDATGDVTAEYPCDGVEPYPLPGALLYRSDADDDTAGLYRLEHETGKVTKLSSLQVMRYIVAGDVAVLNTGVERVTELVAIDIANGKVQWSTAGSSGGDVVIDGEDVVIGIRDGDTFTLEMRSLRDGAARWTAPPVPRRGLKPILVTPALVVAFGAEDHIAVHDRKSGRLVQKLETLAGYAGAAIAGKSLIDIRRDGEVVCWRGA